MDWPALVLSLQLAAATVAILLPLGMVVARMLAWRRFAGRRWVEAALALPLVLPPTVLGYYVLVALGPHGVLGGWNETLAGSRLPFTFGGLLVASSLYSLPFAVQPFTAAFRAVDPRLVEASRSLGASPWHTFRRIVVPLAWPGLLAGMVLSFAHTLGEFGVVLMVGGNIPGVTRTVSIAIYDQVQGLDYDGAGRTSLFLLVVSFLVLSLTYALQRNFRLGNPAGRD